MTKPFVTFPSLWVAAACSAAPRVETVSAPGEPCTAPPREPISFVDVPAQPFQALPSADGCWVYVSLPRLTTPPSRAGGAIAVLKNAGGVLRARVATTRSSPSIRASSLATRRAPSSRRCRWARLRSAWPS